MIVPATGENIDKAAALINCGELVAFPTETVYGLGANALDAAACKKIYSLKGRPSTNPLIIHVPSFAAIASVAKVPEGSAMMEKLLAVRHFWPGPLTVVLPKKKIVPLEVTGGQDSVAVRIPNHKIALVLLKATGLPLAAPSANKSKRVSPTTAKHVEDEFGDELGLILDGGPCEVGVESTILSLLGDRSTVLRPGGITIEQLRECLPDVQFAEKSDIRVPGTDLVHYAPEKPLKFLRNLSDADLQEKIGYISFSEANLDILPFKPIRYVELSATLNSKEIATKLFAALREMDSQSDVKLVVIDSCPEEGLGLTIMNRLKRAVVGF